MLLDETQEDLLATMAEAENRVPDDDHNVFVFGLLGGRCSLEHPGLPKDFPAPTERHLDFLARAGLVVKKALGPHFNPNPQVYGLHVTPEGRAHYRDWRARKGRPVQAVQREVFEYLSSSLLTKRYPAAYQRWSSAKRLADSEHPNPTDVGHRCREALQEFAGELVKGIPDPPPKDRTVECLRAAISTKIHHRGEAIVKYLDSLVALWGETNDLAQRQVHGARREGDELRPEDSRRLLFACLFVMHEIDRALSSSSHRDKSANPRQANGKSP